MKKIIYLAFLIIFFVLAFTFAQKNQQLVNIDYYAGLSVQTQLYLAIFVSLGIGLVLGYLISMTARMRTRGEMKKAQRQAHDAESKLEKIKTSQEMSAQ